MKVPCKRMSPPYILSRYIAFNNTIYCSLTFLYYIFLTFSVQ
nr:MAG TPA: hypothetical protein [Caudoviricetes sp.]